ncbi:MAG: glycine hydroxymethyltransferase [SAR202 cluster bacterium]|nr:glycine hydroxymethyltransferase [SAR202 cluster bacterium]|tara:strand:- start:64951 stop:66480 length:1530 start_codon:yes stop_codon:yes gene_type:complete
MNQNHFITNYLENSSVSKSKLNSGAISYISMIDHINSISPEIARSIVKELSDQKNNLKMIASENFSSLAVQLSMGNLFTDKYAEGFPFHRFYAGCDNVDEIENMAAQSACELFNSENAYVQPHSGADANLIAFWSILNQKIQDPFLSKTDKKDVSQLSGNEWSELRKAFGEQKLLGMNYYSGGHLTHGYRHNVSSRMFNVESYDVDQKTMLIDYDVIRDKAKKFQPLILLAGYSAYPRKINFRIFKEIADEIGAVLMVDMAHFSGLVAGKAFSGDFNPVPFADVITSTTHKTLRGPRGGMVLSTSEFSDQVNKGCPMVMGGPLPHVMLSKALAFKEAQSKEFETYTKNIISNASSLAENCINQGLEVLTGGTDNHLLLIDVSQLNLTGRQAESAIRSAKITLNRNSLPFDKNGPWYTSGLRLGTPAVTSLGMGPSEMKIIAETLKIVLENTTPETIKKGARSGQLSKAKFSLNEEALQQAKVNVTNLLEQFPLYPELDIKYLENHFLVN